MKKLSEESFLLIRNWDSYRDILKAGERLNAEVASVLAEAEKQIKKQEWWNDGWQTHRSGQTQFYITHRDWQCKDEDLVWIGVESFSPANIFGDDVPPSMYVWVSGKRVELKQLLAKIIIENPTQLHGELVASQNGYVVQQSLPKCLPEEAEQFGDVMLTQLLEFLGFYAKYWDEFTMAVKEFQKSGN